MTEQQSRLDLDAALARLKALSTEPGEQAQIIELGSTAWAQGITPELMNVFGGIASSMRLTVGDVRRLAQKGVSPLPLYREVKSFEDSMPWLAAKRGEVWAIEFGGEEIPCTTDGAGNFIPLFGQTGWAVIANGSDRIAAGRRIWPEVEDDK